MSSNWEIDSYRTEYESEEHWELRKKFMLAHKDKFPEDELVCLAQVFTNIEFLGCRYPDKTMMRVAELAKGVVEKYRDDRKNSLKRTFVAASDAASYKNKYPSKNPSLHQSETGDSSKPKKAKQTKMCSANSSPKKSGNFSKAKVSKCGRAKTFYFNSNTKNKKILKNDINIDLGKIVLILDDELNHPINVLQKTASLNKCTLRWKFEKENHEGKFCNLYLNNQIIGSGTGKRIKHCKINAAIEAINKLKESNYSLKVKTKFFSNTTVSSSELKPEEQKKNLPFQLEENNVGFRLLKLMSWKGGGLGRKEQGIITPITPYKQVGRSGFGQKKNLKSFKYKAKNYVKKWLKTDTNQDLVFSSEFSEEERKMIHEVAMELSLKSKSYKKNDSRQIVISRKLSPWEIIEELKKIGGSSSKYELLYPTKPEKV